MMNSAYTALPLYTRRFSRRHPGLFVFVLDQSRSMSEPVLGMNCSKADFAATALNELIYAMLDQTPIDDDTGERRKYIYLSVLGYSDEVVSLLTPDGSPIDLPTLGKHPLGQTTVSRDVYISGTGTFQSVQETTRPYWIKPSWVNATQMDKAFIRARDLIRTWLHSPPEPGQAPREQGFPPVIIHITDGEDNGIYDPEPLSYEIRSEGTQQGATLIFNCHFTANMQDPTIFPTREDEVRHLSPFAAKLLAMSSIIPEPLILNASEVTGRPIASGARGFIYNSNAEVLVKFLNFGTLGTGAA